MHSDSVNLGAKLSSEPGECTLLQDCTLGNMPPVWETRWLHLHMGRVLHGKDS